jgi:hypothetical protein
MDRYSMNFGKKERVLNYTCQTYINSLTYGWISQE